MKKFLLVILTISSAYAQAQTPSISNKYEYLNPSLIPSSLKANWVDDYRLGDEWGKKLVTTQDLDSSPIFKRAALATAKVGGATGFYLGFFNNQHIVATNHHVCPSPSRCENSTVTFPLLNFGVRVKKMIGTWTDVDLSLLIVEAPQGANEDRLKAVAGNFAFNKKFFAGQKLLTIGFGIANNSNNRMMANQDSDCVVFSNDNEFRFMADPDDFNPGPYKAWSFANGCDVSHGDSGSAMVDRETGAVVGIIWTGKIPKADIVQSSKYLKELLAKQGSQIWTELSYAVPAPKIAEFLSNLLVSGNLPSDHKAILTEILK
jgi:S1-C subfamily serine protease